MTGYHLHDRRLTPSERKAIARAFGWDDVDGVGENLIGMLPLYDSSGTRYAWLDEQHVPYYNYDILRFVKKHTKSFLSTE